MILQEVSCWAAIITPILLTGAIIFAFTQWRSVQNARMAQIILSITERWDSKDMEESRYKVNEAGPELKELLEKYDSENSTELYTLVMVGNFFDALGLMVVEGLLKEEMAYKLFGSSERNYYSAYSSVLQVAKHANEYRYFVELHKLFEKCAEKEKAAQSKVKRRLPM